MARSQGDGAHEDRRLVKLAERYPDLAWSFEQDYGVPLDPLVSPFSLRLVHRGFAGPNEPVVRGLNGFRQETLRPLRILDLEDPELALIGIVLDAIRRSIDRPSVVLALCSGYCDFATEHDHQIIPRQPSRPTAWPQRIPWPL